MPTLPVRPRRSVLYLPASNPRAIAKARTLDADCIVLDLEDAVAPEMKAEARAAAVAAAHEGGFGPRELAIRVNGLDTEWGADDLAAVAQAPVDAVLVPKVSNPADIAAYDAALSAAHPAMALWAMIETCGAVLRLDAIGAMTGETRLGLWILGLNDLAKELRAPLTADRAAFLPVITLAACAARAHGLTIIDGVCNEFRDLALFEAEARQGLAHGLDGKSLIHPDQVAPTNTVFSPSPEDLARAAAIIAAFELPENAGKGAIRVDGKMVELLHRDDARRLVAMAERIAARG